MQTSESAAPFTVRVPTGIAGVDTVLHGGLFRGASYLLTGEPGNGKTLFANQLAFQVVATGGRVVYVTLLTETHDQLIAQLRPLAFFDAAALGQSMLYLSGTTMLLQDGLDGFRTFLRTAIRDHQATLLIIDGLTLAHMAAASPLAFEQFLRDVQAWTAVHGCTSVALAGSGAPSAAWAGLVDGVIHLSDDLIGQRAVRFLEVQKFRGSAHLRGRHAFEITARGLEVYPRLEALLTAPSRGEVAHAARRGTGVPTLDTMLEGGVSTGSMTLLLGPPGSGKTSLGLSFLAAGAHAAEVGLYFGFYERPQHLLHKAEQIGVPLRAAVAAEQVTLCWQPPVEDYLDRLLGALLAETRQRGVRRLFLDGIAGLRAAAIHPERLRPVFTALANELRALDVTTLVSLELPDVTAASSSVPANGISAIADNLIAVRVVEVQAQMQHVLQILKVRDSAYDATIRTFRITAHGITIAPPPARSPESHDDADRHEA